MMNLSILYEANIRHNEMMAEAAERRRARNAAHSQPRGFRIDLGDLHISVRIGAQSNTVVNPSTC